MEIRGVLQEGEVADLKFLNKVFLDRWIGRDGPIPRPLQVPSDFIL